MWAVLSDIKRDHLEQEGKIDVFATSMYGQMCLCVSVSACVMAFITRGKLLLLHNSSDAVVPANKLASSFVVFNLIYFNYF